MLALDLSAAACEEVTKLRLERISPVENRACEHRQQIALAILGIIVLAKRFDGCFTGNHRARSLFPDEVVGPSGLFRKECPQEKERDRQREKNSEGEADATCKIAADKSDRQGKKRVSNEATETGRHRPGRRCGQAGSKAAGENDKANKAHSFPEAKHHRASTHGPPAPKARQKCKQGCCNSEKLEQKVGYDCTRKAEKIGERPVGCMGQARIFHIPARERDRGQNACCDDAEADQPLAHCHDRACGSVRVVGQLAEIGGAGHGPYVLSDNSNGYAATLSIAG